MLKIIKILYNKNKILNLKDKFYSKFLRNNYNNFETIIKITNLAIMNIIKIKMTKTQKTQTKIILIQLKTPQIKSYITNNSKNFSNFSCSNKFINNNSNNNKFPSQ